MKALLKKLGDMFCDQGGGVDEKRVLGAACIVVALVYLFVSRDSAGFLKVAVFGGGLLGISVAGDQGKLGGP